ncbi:MAG: alkaline phosphatase family protein [Nanoarchaeota archaeon]|nr:alkaline phosphatase family protein [Nanoarchaeota archaeon]
MLCIFIDAFNPEYLREMPFLNSMKEKCLHGNLEVPLGYTGNIASFMAGVWPDKHGIFDLFVPDEKPHKKISNKFLLGLIRLIKNKKLFYTPPKVKEMAWFKTSLDKNWAQKGCLKYPTLFDILEKNGKSFESIDWPNHFRNRKGNIFFSQNYQKILKMTKKSQADFIFVHFLDFEKAHEFGVKSEEVAKCARGIDDSIRQLWEKDKNILIFSDHGMNDVEKEVNIWKEIKKLNLKFGKDFIYIVGSTTVEFWCKNKEIEKRIMKMLKNLKYGKIVNQKGFHLKTDSLIFLADFKTAFYPNFFSEKRFKAMHGWNPKIQKTYYILKNSEKKGNKNAKMVDFFPTILSLMKIPYKQCDGKSLI